MSIFGIRIGDTVSYQIMSDRIEGVVKGLDVDDDMVWVRCRSGAYQNVAARKIDIIEAAPRPATDRIPDYVKPSEPAS